MRVTLKSEGHAPEYPCDEFGIRVGRARIGGVYVYPAKGQSSVVIAGDRTVLDTTDIEAIRAVITMQLAGAQQ